MKFPGKIVLSIALTLLPVLSHAGSHDRSGTISNLNVAESWIQTKTVNSPTFAFRRTGDAVWYYVSVSEVGIERYEKIFALVLMAIEKNRSIYFEFDDVNGRPEVDNFSL